MAWAEFWYNTTFHQLVGMMQFQALYARVPLIITNYLVGISLMEEVDQELVTREEILKQLKHNLEQAQNWMKQSADVHRREETYNIGSMV